MMALIFLAVQISILFLIFISTTWVIIVNNKNYLESLRSTKRLRGVTQSNRNRETSQSSRTDQSGNSSAHGKAGSAHRVLATLATDEGMFVYYP